MPTKIKIKTVDPQKVKVKPQKPINSRIKINEKIDQVYVPVDNGVYDGGTF